MTQQTSIAEPSATTVAAPALEAGVEEAYAYCRRLTHHFGANFSVGFRFLPRSKRRAVYAAYAFCRYADDIVDETAQASSAEARLARWSEELERCYSGRPTHAITLALADALTRFPIPKEAFAGLVEGCRWDLVKTRYADFAELREYCRLVASTISSISLAIFGYRDPAAIDHGDQLATALQLTNITRDVGDDARRGRIYLPMDELVRFAVREEDILACRPSPEFTALMAFQAERARGYFERAAPLLPLLEADARLGVKLMGGIYARVLGKVVASGYRVLEGPRIGLTKLEKLALPLRMIGRPGFV